MLSTERKRMVECSHFALSPFQTRTKVYKIAKITIDKWLCLPKMSLSFGPALMIEGARRFHTAISTKVVPHKSVKAYATMPIGIMGSHSLSLLGWSSRCFSKKEGKAWIHVFVLFPSITLKHLELRSSNSKPPLPIIPFDIVAYAFTLLWGTTFVEIAVWKPKKFFAKREGLGTLSASVFCWTCG